MSARNFPALQTMAPYPFSRPRRLRRHTAMRALVAESYVSPHDLIWPIFVHDQDIPREPIVSLPGLERLNCDEALKAAQKAVELSIPCLALFPHIAVDKRNPAGSEALNPDGLIPTVTRAIKKAYPELMIMVDVALDPYTDHGHDGLFENGQILNDETIELLIEQTLVQVRAGADIIAPSDMMDGRISQIREALESHEFKDTVILSYAAKYASAFYGPYRDAIGVKALQGDKKTYQMDPANGLEALREVQADLEEGADMVMVKPGLAYLDIIAAVSTAFGAPTMAYQVSGEYAMIKLASQAGLLDERRAVLETMTAFKRAGASGIVTYFAPQIAQWLKD